MQFMIVERFRNGDPLPVYRRLEERGRLIPEGVKYVGSWVADDLTCCYQVMECADSELLDRWLEQWRDLVDFDVIPVISSSDAAKQVASRTVTRLPRSPAEPPDGAA